MSTRQVVTTAATLMLGYGMAKATPPVQSTPDYSQQPVPAYGLEPSFTTGLFLPSRANLLGDAFGLRTFLGQYGITVDVVETSELLGNTSGGVHTGLAYEGLTTATLQVDTARAFGWAGGTLNVSALQIHGRNLSADNLLTLQTASGIEASRATRLWEAWYDQSMFEYQLSLRVGQQSLDQEFITSAGSSLFVNTMMGWPLVPSVDLYAGGPAYPLSSLGARVKYAPQGPFTLLAGVFDDNPPGGPFDDDAQIRGAEQSGTKFNTGTGALFIAELQYGLNTPSLGETVSTAAPAGLPGLYKLGVWYDSAGFPDQRYDASGRSLADPSSDGTPALRRGNWSIYGVFDQTVWDFDQNGEHTAGIFARAMGAPGDRNLADFSINAGIVFKGAFEARKYDSFGVGFGVAKISSAAAALDTASASFANPVPVRGSETFIELTYQAQMAPWWIVQPDLQYVFTPGGGIQNPLEPTQRVGNETVLGVRTTVTF